jgi:hypothetical protein
MNIQKIRKTTQNFFKLSYNDFVKKHNIEIEKEIFDFIINFNTVYSGEELIWLRAELKDGNEITIYGDNFIEICDANGFTKKAEHQTFIKK